MTEQELKGVAFQALNLARTDLTTRGWKTGILIAVYYRTDKTPLTRMDSVEELLLEQLGEGWLRNERKKDRAFRLIRKAVRLFPKVPDAMIFVMPSDMYRPTAKMAALPLEDQKRFANSGRESRAQMARDGLYDVIDSYTAIAQSPEFVVTAWQAADGETAPETHSGPQSDFSGRMKMFGEVTENAQA